MEQCLVGGWLYIILLSVAIGVGVGYSSMYAITLALDKRSVEVDAEMC